MKFQVNHNTVKLRKWRESDAESLAHHANNAKIAQFLTDLFPHPYTLKNAYQFIEKATSDGPQKIFAIEVNGAAVGGIGIHPQTDIFRHNAELGYWLSEDYWGSGIMTNCVKEIVDYSWQNTDVNRIFARPFHTNLGSQKVLQKAGFELEAKLKDTVYKNGVFLDELIYAVRRE